MPLLTSVSLERLLQEIPELRPLDESNLELLRQVRPPEWKNPEPAPRYNLVVLGAGTAGLVTAAGAAILGAKVALVERRLLGGDCLNVGCVPSKALLRSARAVADVRRADRFGVSVPGELAVDFPAVMSRMRRLRARISLRDSAARLSGLGVDVFLGAGRFRSRDEIEVEGKTLRFSRAVIATGARPATPPIPGLEEAGYLTNETVFSLERLPRRLAVIGAGPIGCELAQAFARFGSEVFLVEALHGILPRESRAGAAVVQRAIESDGVRILCCGKQMRIERTAAGKRLLLDSHGYPHELVVEDILVAAGRQPNVEDLGLEAAGVALDRRGIVVNDRLQTTNPRIFAAGDVCSRHPFTHVADAQARIVIRNALFFGRAKAAALTVPWCTYTDPELARVGIGPEEGERQGVPLDTYRVAFEEVDRAILDGEEEGLLEIYARKGTDRILGATLVARHAGDLISELTLAIGEGAGLAALSRTIHPYPTQSEAFRKAGDAYMRTRLTPRLKRILEAFLRWRR